MDSSERAFFRYLRRPGRARYARVVRAYYEFVWTVAARATRHEDDALDLTQDLFVSLLLEPPESGAVRSPRGYLSSRILTLARRKWTSGERRRARELEAARRLAREHSVRLDDDSVDAIRDAVRGLPGRIRDVVELRYLMGFKNREAAATLGVSERTVEDDLRSGRELLRKRLEPASFGALPILATDTSLPGSIVPPPELLQRLLALPELSSSLAALQTATLVGGIAVKKLSTAAAIALLIVSVLVILAVRESEEPAPTVATDHSSDAPTSTTPEPSPDLAASPAVASGASPEAPADTVADEVPPPPDRASVRGFVVDAESREPIAGATVRLERPASESLSASTDETGAYSLDELEPGRYDVTVLADRYLDHQESLAVEPDAVFQQSFVLDPTIALEVTVIDEDGAPIEGVTVTRSKVDGSYGDRKSWSALTGPDGVARLTKISRLKPQQIRARKADYKTNYEKAKKPPSDAELIELSMVLTRPRLQERVVRGSVVDQHGASLQGIEVTWAPTWGGPKTRNRVVTDAAGRFTLEFTTDHDTCHVFAVGEGFAPAVERTVRVRRGEEPPDITLVMRRAHRLDGRVLDEAGRPVEGAKITALPDLDLLGAPATHHAIARVTRSGADGAFRLEDLAGPTVALELRGPSRKVEPGEAHWSIGVYRGVEVDQSLELVLERQGVIRGRVVLAETGEPAGMFKVYLRVVGEWWPRGLDYSRVKSGESFGSPDGAFVLKDLPRGHRFDLIVEVDELTRTTVPNLPVDAAGGTEEHVIEVARATAVAGTVVGGASGQTIAGATVKFAEWDTRVRVYDSYAWSKRPGFQEQMTPVDGSFLFRADGSLEGTLLVLAPGYRPLVIPPPQRARYRVGGGELLLPLLPGATIEGTYFERGKPQGKTDLHLVRVSSRDDGSTRTRQLLHTESKADGGFRFESLDPGDYLITANRRPESGRTRSDVRLATTVFSVGAETRTMTIGDDMGSLIWRGKLVDADGMPLERVSVRLDPLFDWRYGFSTSTRTGGHFRFPELKPGRYQVEVTRDGESVRLPEIELPGDTDAELVVPGTTRSGAK